MLTACGRSSSSQNSGPTLAGNWQIALTPNDQMNFQPRTLSGFAQQTGSSITGSVSFLIPNVQNPTSPPCAGAAPLTGKIDGQNVNLSVNQNGQILTLTGASSSDNSSLSGSYTSSDGTCEPAESGLWTAILIRPIAGSFQAFFTLSVPTVTACRTEIFRSLAPLLRAKTWAPRALPLLGQSSRRTISASVLRCSMEP